MFSKLKVYYHLHLGNDSNDKNNQEIVLFENIIESSILKKQNKIIFLGIFWNDGDEFLDQ